MSSYGGWSENNAELSTAACSQASPASTTASPAVRNDQLHSQSMAWKREEARYYLARIAADRISARQMWHGRKRLPDENPEKVLAKTARVMQTKVLLPRPKAMIIAEEKQKEIGGKNGGNKKKRIDGKDER